MTLTHNGKTQTIRLWSKESGLPEAAIYSRKARGWTDSRTLSEPLINNSNKITKNDAEMWLNDLPIGSVPKSLKHTVTGTGTAKAGMFIRRYFPKDFDRWFNEEYKPKRQAEMNN